MKEFKTLNDILDFAIGEEQAAVDFYLKLAELSNNQEMHKVFTEFAGEEMRHKANLSGIRESGIFTMPEEQVPDLRIADYIVDVRPSPGMSYQDALVLAMKKEKAAFRMYSALAAQAVDPAVKELFRQLALEESRHKLRFEVEYDDVILKEN